MPSRHRKKGVFRPGIAFLMLLAACAPSPRAEAPLGPFPKAALDGLARSFPGRLGFFVKDLKDGVTYGYHEGDRFPPASSIKVAVMIELYRQARAGRIDFSERRPMPRDISSTGCGCRKPRGLTLGLGCYAMMPLSHSGSQRVEEAGRAKSFLKRLTPTRSVGHSALWICPTWRARR